jgi:hypothetical protein
MGLRNLDDLPPGDHEGVSDFLSGSLLDEDYLAHPDKARKLMLGFKKQLR